jgi:hypothetical protein
LHGLGGVVAAGTETLTHLKIIIVWQ